MKRGMNKSGISEMISYVILIAIAIGLSIGVYIWLKDYANISTKIDCKEGTSLILDNYTDQGNVVKLTVKNNGNFNITGLILTVGNNTERMPIKMLLPFGGGTGSRLGHYDFSTPLKPGKTNEAVFIKDEDEIKIIQIQPYIRDKKNNIVVCEQAIIKQEVVAAFDILLIPNLVSWWKFDEISGTTAIDSKDGNDGALIGGVTINQPGKVGTAFSFDGIDDYINVGNNSVFNVNDITLSAWVYSEKIANQQSILSRFPVGGGTGQFNFYIVNSKLNLDIPFIKGKIVTGVTTLSSDQWYYAVYTRLGNVHTLYLNGIQENQTTDPATFVMKGNIWVGAAQNPTAHFNGTIDEVMIFNRSLSGEEIKNIYNAQQKQ